MTWVIDQLIAFFTELRGSSLIAQLLTVAGIPSIIALIFGFPAWLMTRKVRDAVTEYDALEARLKTANGEAAKLKAQVDSLEAETPQTFVTSHKREMSDHNDERAMALAEQFIDNQKEALSLAYRTRMDEAVRQSVEDGAAAFETAKRWALSALALDPTDLTLRMLIDDLSDAAGIASGSKVRVKLKGEDALIDRQSMYDRLPADLNALTNAFYAALGRGQFALMLLLTDHGLMLSRRRPFGEGTREHLLFRRHRCQALNAVGRSREALDELTPLRQEFSRIFGELSSEFLRTRYLLAKCQESTGDAAGALSDLMELLPLEIEVHGERHPNVLTTRYLLAQCRKSTGDAAGALSDLEELLPLCMEVQGERHPDVLSTRYLLAQCRDFTGDAAGALSDLEELLPLEIEVHGERHPNVLTTRYLLAQCRESTGDAAGALSDLEDSMHYIGVLGERHPSVLAMRYLLARCRQSTDDAAGALSDLEELLPLYIEVQGERHPHVLATRILRASCLLDIGKRSEAESEIEGIREALLAAGLLPEHKYFERLEAVQQKLVNCGKISS